MTFSNAMLNYAIIKLGDCTIKGKCIHWEVFNENGCVKLIVDGVEYYTSMNNVLLTEAPINDDIFEKGV